MKLVKKKTKKAIEKSVRKALKRHGPALVAAVTGSLASAIATLAKTESPDKPGKSNLTDIMDKAKHAVADTDSTKQRSRPTRREARPQADDMEDAQRRIDGRDSQPGLA